MLRTAKLVCAGNKELQDRAEIFVRDPDLILVLADGAGGMSGGAEAADFVIRRVQEEIQRDSLNFDSLRELLFSLDREMGEAKCFGETTAVVAIISQEKITGASVGDSGAWMISESGVENLTSHQHRKPLLGSGGAIPICFERSISHGTLLLASDGLLKYASAEKIAATALISDLDRAVEKLVGLVRYASGDLPDDVTVLLARKQ